MGAFETSLEATIARWFSIKPPNKPAKRLAAELAETVKAFEALRGTLVFEDEPSGFEAALQATKDRAPPVSKDGALRAARDGAPSATQDTM